MPSSADEQRYFELHIAPWVDLLTANNEAYPANESKTLNGMTIERAGNNAGYYISGTTTKAGAFTYGDVTLTTGAYFFRCYKPENTKLSKNLYYQLYNVNEDGSTGEQLTKYIGYNQDYYTIRVYSGTKTVRARLYYDAGVVIPKELFRAHIVKSASGWEKNEKVYEYDSVKDYISSKGTEFNCYDDYANQYVYAFPFTPEGFYVYYKQDIMKQIEELKTAIISLGGNV